MARIISHGIHGSVSMAEDGALAGWAFDPGRPGPICLGLLVDGKSVADRTCDSRVADLGVGKPGAQAGFHFVMPLSCYDGAPHVIQLRASDNRLIVFRDDDGCGSPAIRRNPKRKNARTGNPMPPVATPESKLACGFIFLHDKINRLGTVAPLNFFVAPVKAKPVKLLSGNTDEAADLAALGDSGLFDPAFYLSAYPDAAAAHMPPLEHFYKIGHREGRQPNQFFDPNWYLSHNPDTADAGGEPLLLHYLRHGDRQGRDPGPLFDAKWFRTRYDVPASENTLAYYLRQRTDIRLTPIKDFDPEYYAANYRDVVDSGFNLFEHFLTYGYRELRNPSALFNVKYYVQRYLRGDYSKNPLIHFRAHRHNPEIRGRPADDEPSLAREIKRFSKPGPYFEEVGSGVRGKTQAMLLAYYLPQFHSFKENDAWWGKGFTEWTNLSRGVPRFVGHYQPRVPRDLGFYTLDSSKPMRNQIALALANGISGFIFYYYWFNGKQLMDQPVRRFRADKTLEMKYALMWANESWTRRWDGADSEVLISQDYQLKHDNAMIENIAENFKDPRYIRLEGRPLLMVYRADNIPDVRAALDRWRMILLRKFKEIPIFVMAQTCDSLDPFEYGFDGAVEFPPHKLVSKLPSANADFTYLDTDFSGNVLHYDNVVDVSLENGTPPYPLIKTAIPSWDNDARRQGAGITIVGSTPAKYEAWLSKLVDRARTRPFFGTPLVCVNAWNEWCEGAYLEPDQYFGGAYLNATARAMSEKTANMDRSALTVDVA